MIALGSTQSRAPRDVDHREKRNSGRKASLPCNHRKSRNIIESEQGSLQRSIFSLHSQRFTNLVSPVSNTSNIGLKQVSPQQCRVNSHLHMQPWSRKVEAACNDRLAVGTALATLLRPPAAEINKMK
jgi:hypothetical protein